MVKIQLSSHADVLARQGDKFYVQGDRVFATMCVDNAVAYTCVTDEDPARALSPTDNRLNNAMRVEGFDLV